MASSSMPSMPSVPLMRASPSLAARLIGLRPLRRSASPPSIRSPDGSSTHPSPSSTRAQCASGARSPLAPSEPCSGTQGVMSWLSRSTSAWATSGRVPDRPIARDRTRSSIIARTHSRGIGAPMPRECVRAMMLLRVRSLAMGLSGTRPEVAQALVDLLNHDITPWVPEHGSLGASGDLAPLAHCALVLLGEGWVLSKDGARVAAADALAHAGLRPIDLSSKEGLALINGTDGMLGMLLMAIADAGHLFAMADVTAALATEAMLGSDRPFAPEIHAIRPHPGQAVSAANIHRLLQNSGVMDSHRDDFEHAVQDAYSIRCA